MEWRFGFADPFTLQDLGELHWAREERVWLPFKGLQTASLRLRIDDPMALEVTDPPAPREPGDVMLKVYQDVGTLVSGSLGSTGNVTVNSTAGHRSSGVIRVEAELITYTGLTATQFTGCTRGAGGTTAASHPSGSPILPLRFFGDLVSAEEIADGGAVTLQCNFVGALDRLRKRLCGKTDYSVSPPNTQLVIAPQDLGTTLWQLTDVSNTESDTGIRQGTITPSVNSACGPWAYKPIREAYEELGDVKVFPFEGVSSWPVLEDFNHASWGGGLCAGGGKPLQVGPGNWAGAGNPTDATVEPDNTLKRAAITDETLDRGRFLFAGTTTLSDAIVQTNAQFLAGPIDARLAVFARHSGPSTFLTASECWIMAAIEPLATSLLTVRKCVNGAYETLEQSTLPALSAVFHTIRLQVEATGRFFVWGFGLGSIAETLLIEGYDPDLKTGGPLASGRIGIYDAYIGTDTAATRVYDGFRAATPTATVDLKGVDWELVPAEPLAGGADAKRIAVLNTSPKIGVDRDHCVFEHGDDPSVKSYRRVIDRDGQINRGHSLPSNFPDGTDVKKATNVTAFGKRGLQEEVISSDVADPGLRQALTDHHVAVRGPARQVVTFDPGAVAPMYGRDYLEGDSVVGRGKVGTLPRYNGMFRVHAVEVQVDNNRRASAAPSVVPDA